MEWTSGGYTLLVADDVDGAAYLGDTLEPQFLEGKCGWHNGHAVLATTLRRTRHST